MSKRSLAFLAIVITLILPGQEIAALGAKGIYRFMTTYTISNRGDGPITLLEDEVSISLFMNSSYATVRLVQIEPRTEMMKRDEDGNLYAIPQLKRMLSPGDEVTIKAVYEIVSRRRPIPDVDERDSGSFDDIDYEHLLKYCTPIGPWRYNEWASVKEFALSLKGDETNVLKVVKRFVTGIHETINYRFHEVPYYPNSTLYHAEGDCDDQANLLISMCRSVGIPAYLQIGSIFSKGLGNRAYSIWNDHLTVKSEYVGWHGWAMVYIPPWGWLPVDLTWAKPDDGYGFITRSALSHDYTIPSEKVETANYVLESENQRSRVERLDIFITVEDVLVVEDVLIHGPEEDGIEEVPHLQEMIPTLAMAISALGLALTIVLAVFVVIVIVKESGLE